MNKQEELISLANAEVNNCIKGNTFTITSKFVRSLRKAGETTNNLMIFLTNIPADGIDTVIIDSDVDNFYTGTYDTLTTLFIRCGMQFYETVEDETGALVERIETTHDVKVILKETARYDEIVLTNKEVEGFAFSLVGDVSLRKRASEIKEYYKTYSKYFVDDYDSFLSSLRNNYIAIYNMNEYYKELAKNVTPTLQSSHSAVSEIITDASGIISSCVLDKVIKESILYTDREENLNKFINELEKLAENTTVEEIATLDGFIDSFTNSLEFHEKKNLALKEHEESVVSAIEN